MTTTEAREALADAIAARTIQVRSAEKASPRAQRAAWRAVEEADMAVRFAQVDVEMAVRRAMPDATEAEIQFESRR